MGNAEGPEIRRAHRLRRIAVIAGIALAIVILLAVAVYTVAFLILAPMMA